MAPGALPQRRGRAGAGASRSGKSINRSFRPTMFLTRTGISSRPLTRSRVQLAGRKCGLTICEDVWVFPFLPRRLYPRDPVRSLVSRGAEIILNISASPFNCGQAAAAARDALEAGSRKRTPAGVLQRAGRKRPVDLRRQLAGLRRAGTLPGAIARRSRNACG